EKMSKSKGNVRTLSDLIAQGIDPLAFRYFFLQAHYRQQQSYGEDAIQAAATGYRRLQGVARELGVVPIEVGTEAEPPAATAATAREESGAVAGEAYRQRFRAALADDLNAPKAMAVVWEVARSESLPKPVRRTLLRAFDTV